MQLYTSKTYNTLHDPVQHLLSVSWIAHGLRLMQHKDLCLCACGSEPADHSFYDVLIFMPFSTVKKKKCTVNHGWKRGALTHQVFPVFQSSPVTPADQSGGRSQMQSVSMFIVVSDITRTAPLARLSNFFKYIFFHSWLSLHICSFTMESFGEV